MIGAIENGILAAIKSVSDSGALGYRFRSLDSYPEDWDEYLKDKDALVAPAAWVVFAGWRKLEGDAARPTVELTFGVVVMAENMRNETATRHGGVGPAEPGSYQLAEDVFQILGGRDLGLGVGLLEPRSLRFVARFPALQERKVSMMALELACSGQIVATDPDTEELGPFALFHANWDIPPHGNVDADPEAPGVQIPADETADATDEVHLETEQ